jgi:hypothetical protein
VEVTTLSNIHRSRSWKLARRLTHRIDELEMLLARLHRVCAIQLGLRPRLKQKARRATNREERRKEARPA